MNEQELLQIVNTLLKNEEGVSGERLWELTERFSNSIPHPGGTALLHYPEQWGLSPDASAEEIVREALSWRPRVLAMSVSEVRKHAFREGLFAIIVEVKGRVHTQVISAARADVGDVYAVALSGVKLPDGREVKHGFVHRMYSAGELLGRSDQPEGAELSPDETRRSYERGRGGR